jgi:hypothetical protein
MKLPYINFRYFNLGIFFLGGYDIIEYIGSNFIYERYTKYKTIYT